MVGGPYSRKRRSRFHALFSLSSDSGESAISRLAGKQGGGTVCVERLRKGGREGRLIKLACFYPWLFAC